MSALVNVLFVLLWMGIGFVVLRYAAVRYFGDPRRAAIEAGAVVVAFTLGALWPYGERFGGERAATAPVAPVADDQSIPLASNGRDVRAICAASSPGSEPVAGHVDLFGVVRGDRAQPRSVPITVAARDQIVVMGWAADAHVTSSQKAACLIVDGKMASGAETLYHLPRPDIATAFHSEPTRDTGYQIVIPAARIGSGRHQLGIAVVTSAGKGGVLPQTFDVTFP